MTKYLSAITFGVALGSLLCVAGNKASSHLARGACVKLPDTHQVVFTSTFLGDTYSCVDKRWL